jgi:hypothetical protein
MRCTSLISILIVFVLTLLLIPISSATNQTPLLPARAKYELLSLQTKFSTRMNEHNNIMSLHLSGLKSAIASILDAFHISLVDLIYIRDLMANGDNKTSDMEQVVKILCGKLKDGTTTTKKGTVTDSFDTSVRVARMHLKAMAKEIDSLYAFNEAMRSKMAILKINIEAIDRQQAVPSFENDKESLVKGLNPPLS